jgi:hypothetical protein
MHTTTSFAQNCSEYKVVYARGSGQKVSARPGESGYENERDTLRSQLASLNTSTVYQIVELDEKSLGLKGSWPAVKVDGESIQNGLSAYFSRNQMGDYRQSVFQGTELLNEYMQREISQDQNKCFVLTGYSQGAHVIGDYLTKYADKQTLAKIKYVGLFGDPKYDTSGFGFTLAPGQRPAWMRGNLARSYFAYGGSLDARRPYLPSENGTLAVPVGSWCYNDDFVCNNDIPYVVANGDTAHGMYSSRAIPLLAKEIQSSINFPDDRKISASRYPDVTCGPTKQDIVVAVDTSPFMRRNKDLFTDTPLYTNYEVDSGGHVTLRRTAGEQLLRVGCKNIRVAVVGYGRPQDGTPKLLLDFTTNASDYDNLMSSLYQPSSSGTFQRTQYREAVLSALDAEWRSDAAKTVFVITNVAGTGPAMNSSASWSDRSSIDAYLADPLSQQLVDVIRSKDISLLGMPIFPDYSNYIDTDSVGSGNTEKFLRMMSQLGGYYWIKQASNYGTYNFKYTDLTNTVGDAMKLNEKLPGTVSSVRGKVGDTVQLDFDDPTGIVASAELRSEGGQYQWHIDCDKKANYLATNSSHPTFVATKPEKCEGELTLSIRPNWQNGCYSSCPEAFPPYMQRTFPFSIDIKPADYVDAVPGPVRNVQEIVYNDHTSYTWDAPDYRAVNLLYIIKDIDGTVLARTTSHLLTITDTAGVSPIIKIIAAGDDGSGPPVVSNEIRSITDRRTVQQALSDTNESREGMPAALAVSSTTNTVPISSISTVEGRATVLESAAGKETISRNYPALHAPKVLGARTSLGQNDGQAKASMYIIWLLSFVTPAFVFVVFWFRRKRNMQNSTRA